MVGQHTAYTNLIYNINTLVFRQVCVTQNKSPFLYIKEGVGVISVP